MKTSKKTLEIGYNALSNVIAAYRSAKRPTEDQPYGDDLDMLIEVMRRQGSMLISMVNDASIRCDDELISMCESLIDQSSTLIIEHKGL